MRSRILVLSALLFTGSLSLSFTRGQERPTASPAPGGRTAPSVRDLSKLTDLQKQMAHCAQRGAEWLFRMNDVKGRFEHGHVPALAVALDGDHLLRQAGAAFALARAARFTGEERYAARATQAVLALLDETEPDNKDTQILHSALPTEVVNRLGAAGYLVLAVHELAAPQPDLLDKAEQLCGYVRKQVRTDGSLACAEASEDGKFPADDAEAINAYPGVALYGLLRSHKLRPAAWKLETARKALAFYRNWWKTHKDPAFVPWQTAACAEAFALTKETAFAEFAFEMNDFLCGLQYDQINPRQQRWYGGFMGWSEGRAVETAPRIQSADYAEALAAACRIAGEQADIARHERYGAAFERSFQFLVTLQYTDGNTKHFAAWYRDKISGGFHASHQDGNLRIDYTQHAVAALVQYLELVGK